MWRVVHKHGLRLALVDGRLEATPSWARISPSFGPDELEIARETFGLPDWSARACAIIGEWFAWLGRLEAAPRPSNPVICPEGARRWKS